MKLLLGAGKADGGPVDEWAEQKGERCSALSPFQPTAQGGWGAGRGVESNLLLPFP